MKKLFIICLILLAFTQAATAQPVVDYLHITADVNNGYATTTIEEKLTNQMDKAINDEFSFLIPEEAFISGFSLIINGKEYKADVLRKEEAAEKFEEAASQGRTAGLMEAKKSNLFSYSLSFAPQQSIIVRLTYEQAVKKSLGEYEYFVFLRSNYNVNDLSVNLSITSVNEITTLETPGFTGANIKYLSTTNGQVTYNTNTLPDSDLRVIFTTNNPPLNGDMLFYKNDDQVYLMHVFSPTEEDLGTTALSKEIIFVIDKSGSMSGDKITQVKSVFSDIISELPPDDYFNVIFFDSSIRAYASTLKEANTENKAEAANFVNSLDAAGGTNIHEALLHALKMFNPESERVPIIVFLTDGEPTEGITSPHVIRKNIKEANEAEVSIFTNAFGIEDEDNYNFLKAMSLENYGKSDRFYQDGNVETEISGFYETISTPLITDMDFTYGGQVSDIVNTGENNLFAGSDAIVLGKCYPGTSTITSNISAITRTGSRDFTNTFAVVLKPEHSFIPKLWAYTTIKDLLDQIDVEGETETLVTAVTDLSLEFKFVTPYTSLFVEIPTEATTTVPIDESTDEEGDLLTPSATSTPVMTRTAGEQVTEMGTVAATAIRTNFPSTSTPASTQEPNPEPNPEPGFEAISAVLGLLAITYLLIRKRME